MNFFYSEMSKLFDGTEPRFVERKFTITSLFSEIFRISDQNFLEQLYNILNLMLPFLKHEEKKIKQGVFR